MLLTDVSRSEFEQLFPDERLPGNTPGQLYDREALWQMVQQDKSPRLRDWRIVLSPRHLIDCLSGL